jgi:phosphatidylserine decarboxylase
MKQKDFYEMKVAKEAYALIIPTILIIIVFSLLKIVVVSIIVFVFLCFTIYFFRDPERKFSDEQGSIISPADGKIVTLDEVDAPDKSGKKMRRVGIFMSIFDVHINRSPFQGTINLLKYNKGKFLNALNDKSSEKNENNIIGIDIGGETIFVKQIAGIIARRIVCRVKIDDEIQKGKRLGMIKFGSRVEAYLPIGSNITVKLGDKVKAGESIIGYVQYS